MAEAEALEVLSNISINAATYWTMFVSFTFAYLTVAYFVGKSLSRFQCVAIFVFYIICAFMSGVTTVGWSEAWFIFKAREHTFIDDVIVFTDIGLFYALIFVLSAISITSLYFMCNDRRR